MAAPNDHLKKLLECPVCYERFKPPIETCENGHGICKNCRKLLGNCGICREKFTHAKNTLLNQIIELLEIEDESGSGWWFTFKKIIYNIICFFFPHRRIKKCRYNIQGCTESFPGSRIKDHEKICYYRNEKCIVCLQETCLIEMNDHFKNCKDLKVKSEIKLLTCQKIYSSIKSIEKDHYVAMYVANIECYFLVRFINDAKKMFFCVQYLGRDQEDAKKYKYDVKIDQGMPPPNQSYFSWSGFCVPYLHSKEEVKKQKGVIELDLKWILLTDDCLESRKLDLNIKLCELS